ncbi:MAG TPA: hypothetical protein PLU35_07610 [Phycisphaerales bacterium]|nr:hypothetical protein [Phycisphaerales bacterium]
MRVCRGFALSLVALFAGAAPAQPVFFDDFDGDDLLPHWSTPPDICWEYSVSGGMLQVTGLFCPSDPEDESNWAIMGAGYEPQTDFRADVWMGWEPGDQPHKLAFHVIGPQGQGIASFGYWFADWLGPDPLITASTGGGDVHRVPAPMAGVYQFTLVRSGTEFEFFFNGNYFASFTDRFGTPAAIISLEFVGPFPGELGVLHVDRVRIVPSPGVLSVLAGAGVWRSSRRRCSRRVRRAACSRHHHDFRGGSK